MAANPNSLQARDIAYHLHPQTNLALHEQAGPVVMVRGQGALVYDDAGKEYLDAMAGMWSASLGFSEPRLVAAATRQMETLPYYQTFAHRSTEPAIELAETLIRLAPLPMSKVLFQVSGSDANDTAVKLIWYYFNATGRPAKRKIISRMRAYHGSTIVSASLTGLPHLHRDFNLPLDGFLHVDCPHYYRNAEPGESEETFATRMAQQLEEVILREGPDTVAAFFAEPVMGTGGVVVPPATYFAKIQEVLRRHEVLLVADEVICGFGRTGSWWGSQTFDLRPDMLTCAKALSASYIPISALLLSEPIYQAMRSESEKIGIFGHGFTYGGHPVAAAVANEAIRIYEERDLMSHAARMGAILQRKLRAFAGHPLVGEVRGVGLMAGVEIVQSKRTKQAFDPKLKIGLELQQQLAQVGLIARALGDSIVFSPPLIVGEAEIDAIAERFGRGLDNMLGVLAAKGLELDRAGLQ